MDNNNNICGDSPAFLDGKKQKETIHNPNEPASDLWVMDLNKLKPHLNIYVSQ